MPRRSGEGTQPDVSTPPAALRSSPSAVRGRSRPAAESNLQRIRTRSPRAVHQGFAPDNHTADRRARWRHFRADFEGTFLREKSVECRLSNTDRGKQIPPHIARSIEEQRNVARVCRLPWRVHRLVLNR